MTAVDTGGLNFDLGALLNVVAQRYPNLLPIMGKPGVWDTVTKILADPPEAWPQARVDQAIQNTDYYKNTPIEQRQWDALTITDPATANEQGIRAAQMVEDTTRQLGINLSGADKFNLTAKAVTGQWDQNRLKYELLSSWWVGGTGADQGPIADAATQYHAAASNFGIKADDQTALSWGRKIASGQATIQDATESLRGMAATTYPGIAEFIHQGGSVKDFAQPYLQLASTELGIPTSAMPLDDPKWTSMFLGQDAKGQQGVLSYQEAQQKLRSDPTYGYDHSPGATQQASQFAQGLLQKFGFGT